MGDMEKKLLTPEKEEALRRQRKASYFVYGVLAFLFCVSLFLLFFFQNRSNSYWILPLVCVFDSLLLLCFIYLLTAWTRELKAKARLYERLKKRKPQTQTLSYLGKEEETTTVDGLSCFGYSFQNKTGRRIVVYVLEEESLDLTLGQDYSCVRLDSFLLEVKSL